ncbi:MAG: DNA ligase-1 [Myxococcota bacterium]|jgi:DNA ligase-1
MLLNELVETSAAVAATRSRTKKVAALAALLTRDERRAVMVHWLAGELPQGRIGVGYAALQPALGTPPAAEPGLRVAEVDDAFSAIGGMAGKGSKQRRHDALVALLGAATAEEQAFLVSLVAGGLRQGALAGLMADAVAKAAEVPAAAVRRAAMLSGDLTRAALAAFEGGEAALSGFRIQLFRPVQPMLASPADDVEAALERLGTARLEWKLDGARIQVHRRCDEVRVYTRALHDVTGAVPEVVEAALGWPCAEAIVDGEVIALHPSGRPLPFQDTMRRFGRTRDVAAMRAELPLTAHIFDLLHLDGAMWIDRPQSERMTALAGLVGDATVPSLHTDDPAEARAFLQDALDRGHEGVMAKDLTAPYAAGSRGFAWLKLKSAWTLDLVVLAVEWGSGRRRGRLSNLHLGARDGDGFVMLGKTFKGMTDAMLAWQTEALLALETHREGHVVHVRPELVVEIAFNELQVSPRYPGGLALRFARVKGYRTDKRSAEADTLDTVRAIHAGELRHRVSDPVS